MLGTVCALLAGVYLYRRVDEEIRFHVESILARHYQGLAVSVGSARLLEREGISIRSLSISDRAGQSSGTEPFFCDEIYVHCQPTLKGLMAGDLNVRQMTVRGVKIRATRFPDGTWNLASLFPLPRFGPTTPPTTVENATLELVAPARGPPRLLTLRDINLQLTPRTVLPAELNSDGATAPTIEIEGTLTGDHFQRVELSGSITPCNGQYSFRGNVFELAIDPELRHALPANIGSRLEPLGALRALGVFGFQVDGNLQQGSSIEYRIVGDIRDGRIVDRRLAYPLTDLQAHVDADNRVLRIDKATARYGAATLQLSCWRDGFLSNSPALVSGSVRNLAFERKLVELLPEKLRFEWAKYQPIGTVDADFRLRFDGQQWRGEEMGVTCLDVALKHHIFSYPLRHATGRLMLKDDVLELLDFRALAGDTPILIAGTIRHPGPDWSGQFTLRSEGSLPLDRQLIEATTGSAQRIIRDFAPRGSVSFLAQYARPPGQQAPIGQDWIIDLHDCWLKHVQFPYPLEKVQGRLHMQDGYWEFSDLSGRNDSADVRCDGSWNPDEAGGKLTLNFEARDVQLEPELRDALTPDARDLWDRARPQGTLDRLNATFTYAHADRHTSLSLKVEQLQSLEAQQDAKRSVTIFPQWFPYRIEDLSGVVTYQDGDVTLTQLRGMHGLMPISAEGVGQVRLNGDWRLRLDRLVVDRLPVDRELVQAMPSDLRNAVTTLKLTGPISLDGSLELARKNEPDAPVTTDWNMLFHVNDGSLDCGIALIHVTGAVTLIGNHDGRRLRSHGSINIDSLTYRGFQLTEVQGPLWLDNKQLLLGASVPADPGRPPSRRVTAKVFGGSVEGDGRVWLDKGGQFELQAQLLNADLAELIRDVSHRPARVHGRSYAVLRLAGTAAGTHTLRGDGQVELSDADIGELPLIVALVNRLYGTTDRRAFSTSVIRFRVLGEAIYLDQIDLSGDAITLKGQGEMGLDGRVDIDFYSLLGRERDYLPAVLPFLGEASRRFLRIHVRGTLDEPQTTQNMLPIVNETLQQLFPETASSVDGRTKGLKTAR